ncbi:MAG: hypothetical protein KC731_16125 [Myxococcales bacterium]|nr:hypothetical protein [Myxococcales bacterium]
MSALKPTICAVLAVVAVSAAGCSKHYIPNTDVEDTDDNREIVAFCELYRRAIERKDVPALLELASPHYYEDGGNVDASDDIDFAGLREYLLDRFADASAIRYEIRYRRVTRTEDYVYVDYTYSGSFRLPSEEGNEKWRSTVEENRLELVLHDDGYRIVAGM